MVFSVTAGVVDRLVAYDLGGADVTKRIGSLAVMTVVTFSLMVRYCISSIVFCAMTGTADSNMMAAMPKILNLFISLIFSLFLFSGVDYRRLSAALGKGKSFFIALVCTRVNQIYLCAILDFHLVLTDAF